MTSFFAIIKLTCRSAMRSNVFRFLLFLLILCVILVPNTLKGDGTAKGYLQVMLEYSTAFVAFILSTSIIWLSCSEICTDLENGQLHMIVVKPVSRVTVWLGKFLGVFLIHFVLLILSFAFIYVFLMFQYGRQNFTKLERLRMETEVFAGRRSFTPYLGDMNKKVKDELERRINDAKKSGSALPYMDGAGRRRYMESIRAEILAKEGTVQAGQVKTWYYTGLPKIKKSVDGKPNLAYIGFMPYSGEIGSKNQKIGNAMWIIRYVQKTYDENIRDKNGKPTLKSKQEIGLPMPPEQIITCAYKEIAVPAEILIDDGTASIAFRNLQNKNEEAVYFQVTEGPRILVKETSFLNNYIRAMFVVGMGIFTLGMIASAFAGFLSMPTAIFLTISYILVGLFSAYLGANLDFSGSMEFLDRVGGLLSVLMSRILIPVQDFAVSGILATGTLVEFEYMLHLLLVNIIFRGLPLGLLGIWLYWRRETALAMKQ